MERASSSRAAMMVVEDLNNAAWLAWRARGPRGSGKKGQSIRNPTGRGNEDLTLGARGRALLQTRHVVTKCTKIRLGTIIKRSRIACLMSQSLFC